MRAIKHLAWSLAAVAALATAQTTYPLTVTDSVGRTVTLPAEPRRIVAMLPSHTETLFALGVGERVVGVDDFSNHPPDAAGIPRLGNLFNPGVEAIVASRPDLILLDRQIDLAETLAAAGLTVVNIHAETIAEALAAISTIGRLVNRPQAAASLVAGIREQLAAVGRQVSPAAAPRVFYEISEDLYTAGPNSFIGQLITAAGGRNVIPAELGTFPQVSPELVIRADPEVILLSDAPYGVTARSVAARPGWAGVSAVRNGRVIALSSQEVDVINRPGPRLGQAVALLAAHLHPARSGPRTGRARPAAIARVAPRPAPEATPMR